MNSLLRKELRAQRPFLLLIGFVTLLNLSDFLGKRYPDTRGIAGQLNTSSGELGFVLLVLAMALALALLPREKDEGTLEFLDGLPCTRGHIFAAKAWAGILVLGLYPILDNACGLLLHRLGRSSLDPAWPLGLFGTMLLLEWWLAIALLGVALALSFFRRFAFFVLGLLLAAYLALDAADHAWVRCFDFTAVVRYTFRHGQIDVAWLQLLTLSALGAAGYVIAWFCFRLQGDRSARILGWLERNHFRGPLVAIGTVLTVALWVGLGGWLANTSNEDRPKETARVEYRGWGTSRLTAGGYVFLHPANVRDRAAALADRAAEVQEKVRAFFGADPVGEIVADLDSSMRHVAGTAEWKRINMNITTTRPAEHVAVLGHETAHVYIEAVSEGRLQQHGNAARWWHEGLASYVEFRFFRPPADLAKIHRVAAAAYRQKAADFESLVDDGAWRARHNSELVYPLGEVFFESLVAEHGDAAPGRILRAICRPDAPQDATGIDLWRDAFQACGWDMSRTISAYFERVAGFATGEHLAFVASLPKLYGRVLVKGERVEIEVIVDGKMPPGATLRCRVRRLESDSDARGPLRQEGDRTFVTNLGTVGRGEFWYQLGIAHPQAQFTLYEDWQRARSQ